MPNTATVPRLPPGPASPWWGFPLIGAMRRDYLNFVKGLQAYGDVTFMRLVWERAYDVLAPDLVRQVLVDNAAHLIRWERGIEVFEQVFGQSVLVTEGETWQRQRRMLHAAFTPKRVAGYADLMCDAAHTGLQAAVPASSSSGLVDMDVLFTRVTMDVIMRTLFGARADGDSASAAQATQTLSKIALREMFHPFTLPDWLPLPGKAAKRRAMATLRSLIAAHIAEHPATAAPSADLLSMLQSLRDEQTGQALSAQEIFDQCMVSFQAGHETTATALLWWSRLMAEHPQAAQRAREEVDQALGQRLPQAGDVAHLPWLGATLKEAMRLYPPVAAIMTRRTTAPIEVGGWTIPQGALVRITPWVLQRDPRWFDAPDAFVPERFLPGAAAPPRGAWMPFGAGPRVCIGQHFATLEMTLIAALLLQRYDMTLPADAAPVKTLFNVTLRPLGGVKLWLTRRASTGCHN